MAKWICANSCVRECGCYPAGHYEGEEFDADFCHLCARELYNGDCVNVACPPPKKKITKQSLHDLSWDWYAKELVVDRQAAAEIVNDLWEFFNERRN